MRINFMLTNGSIDVFMLQKLQAKQPRYLETMKKGANVLDVSNISTQELKTSIITNSGTRANIEIELLKKKIETEKNRFLADSAFVLRKYDVFLKVKEEVTKAENSYSRILGYAKDSEDGNSEYWTKQLPSYKKAVDLAKIEVQNTISNLSEKGVNVGEIEMQTKATETKIAELDRQIEELPATKEKLVSQYKKEKDEQRNAKALSDHLIVRAMENNLLFKEAELVNGKTKLGVEDGKVGTPLINISSTDILINDRRDHIREELIGRKR